MSFINKCEFRDFRGRWIKNNLRRRADRASFLPNGIYSFQRPTRSSYLTTLVSLRTFLRSMIETLVEGTITEQDQATLNTIMLKMPLCRHIEKDTDGYGLEMVPIKRDWDWVQAEITASFAHVLAYHDPITSQNMRKYLLPLDLLRESKSRTKLYCRPEKCANLWKARRYRARHKNNQ